MLAAQLIYKLLDVLERKRGKNAHMIITTGSEERELITLVDEQVELCLKFFWPLIYAIKFGEN